MVEAFEHTAAYDTMIYNHFSKLFKKDDAKFPKILDVKFEKVQDLRYGENPHQLAAFYKYKELNISEPCISSAVQLHGKELSFNNILDANSSIEIIKEFDMPAATIIKHTNPCGTACADNIDEAYRRAYDADSLSAFGGIITLNRKLSKKIAEHISSKFIEIIIAPDYDTDALEILQKKKRYQDFEKLPGLKVKAKQF